MLKGFIYSFIFFLLVSCSTTPELETTAFEIPDSTEYTFQLDNAQFPVKSNHTTYVLSSGNENQLESMPVYIDLVDDSKPWIIHVHGGPGSLVAVSALSVLSDQFNLMYFQQRGAGIATGPDYSNLSINSNQLALTYLKDLGFLVKLLKNTYPNQKIVLYGESWGVMYALMYVIGIENGTYFDASYRVDGVICDSGSLKNIKDNFEASIEELETFPFTTRAPASPLDSDELSLLNTDYAIFS